MKIVLRALNGDNTKNWIGTKKDSAGNTNITFNWNRLGNLLLNYIIQPVATFLDERDPSSPNYLGNISEEQRQTNSKARDREIRIAKGEENPTILDAALNGLSAGFNIGIWNLAPMQSKTLHGFKHSPWSTRSNLEAKKGQKKALEYLLSDEYMAENLAGNSSKKWKTWVSTLKNGLINNLMNLRIFTFPIFSKKLGGIHFNNTMPFYNIKRLPYSIRKWETPEFIWLNSNKEWNPLLQEAAAHEVFHGISLNGRGLNNRLYSLFYHGPWTPKKNLITDFKMRYPIDKAQKKYDEYIDYLKDDELWARVMTDKAFGGNLNTFNGKQLVDAFGRELAENMLNLNYKPSSLKGSPF